MPITKAEVIEVLRDGRLRNISFSVGPINVNSDEFAQVADYVKVGAIKVLPRKLPPDWLASYRPDLDTMWVRDDNPPFDNEMRSALLHECAHAIADLNKYKVQRVTSEVASYLAEFGYLYLLDPLAEMPPISPLPQSIRNRQGMLLAKRLRLGEPAGIGKIVNQEDTDFFGGLIKKCPGYENAGEMMATDGVDLTDDETKDFDLLQVSRIHNQYLREIMAKEIEAMLNGKSGSHDNSVTDDSELLSLFQSSTRGTTQQRTALQELAHIFLTVDQGTAVRLLYRLSTLRKGDILSERFQSTFALPERTALLSALQQTR